MKLSRERHGIEGVKATLDYIDAGGPEQIDGDDHEVMGETEDGRDACSTFSISQIAGEAFATIEHLEQQRDQLAEALGEMLLMISDVDLRTGYCCCGSPVDGHGLGDGHAPVDDGEYHAYGIVEKARAALQAMEDE